MINCMPSVTRIAAYTFNADTYCPGCMREMAIAAAQAAGSARSFKHSDTEAVLDGWAHVAGVDRHDERSFDSGNFPKVVFLGQVCDEEHEHCGSCREDLCSV